MEECYDVKVWDDLGPLSMRNFAYLCRGLLFRKLVESSSRFCAGKCVQKRNSCMEKSKKVIGLDFFTVKNLIIDFCLVCLFLFIPTVSHVLSFPLYTLEPIRIAVLAAFLLTKRSSNAYLLAVVIPITSFLASGHPVFYKSLLMMGEMLINVFLFSFLFSKKINVFFAMVVSIICSKLVYYFLKVLFIQCGLLKMNVIDTNLWIQVSIMILTALIFSLFSGRLKR